MAAAIIKGENLTGTSCDPIRCSYHDVCAHLLINTSLYFVAITNNEVAKAADIPTQNVVGEYLLYTL